jgi:hypothetical protein
MADLKLALLLELKDQATKKFGSLKSTLGDIGKTALGVFSGQALLGGVTKLADGIGDMVQESLKIPDISRRFENLSGSVGETSQEMLTSLRGAVQGTATDMDLMLQGTRLMSMGLAESSTEAAQLAKVAYELGDPTQTLSANFENLALMLANQSIPRLDTFGISGAKVRERMAELTEGTGGLNREQAFMAAFMEQSAVSMEKVGPKAMDLSTQMEQMKSQMTNVKHAIGGALVPVLGTLMSTIGPVVVQFLQGLIPAAQQAGVWLKDNLPAAIATASTFFSTTLQPILTTVAGFIGETLVPGIGELVTWLGENIPKAIATAKQFWEEKLKPALETVWNFIDKNVLPIFKDLVSKGFDLVKDALETGARIWKEDLEPALRDVWSFISVNVVPIFQSLGNSLGTVKDALEGVWGKITGFGDALSNLADKIPAWILGRSPSPLETSLRGIGDALRELSGSAIPEFAGSMGTLSQLFSSFAGLFGVLSKEVPVQKVSVKALLDSLSDILHETGAWINAHGVPFAETIAWFDRDLRPILEKWQASLQPLTSLFSILGSVLAVQAAEVKEAKRSLTQVLSDLYDFTREAAYWLEARMGSSAAMFGFTPLEVMIEQFHTVLRPLLEKWAESLEPLKDIAALASTLVKASADFANMDILFTYTLIPALTRISAGLMAFKRHLGTQGLADLRGLFQDVTKTLEAMLELVDFQVSDVVDADALYRSALDVGVSIGDGLVDGIRSMIYAAGAAGSDLANSAISGAELQLEVASESKAFRRLGVWAVEGFVGPFRAFLRGPDWGRIMRLMNPIGLGGATLSTAMIGGTTLGPTRIGGSTLAAGPSIVINIENLNGTDRDAATKLSRNVMRVIQGRTISVG